MIKTAFSIALAGLALVILVPLVWIGFLTIGALGGWLTVWGLSLIFTFDYDLARTIGLVIGALVTPATVISQR